MKLNKQQNNKGSASSSQDGFTPTPNFKKKGDLVSGFTLIELMIATTLFTIIMLMGVGALVVSSNSAKASQKLRIAVDNVNFAMENMTRELRMGTHYYCDSSYNMADNNAVRNCEGEGIMAFNSPVIEGSYYRVGYYRKARTIDGVADGTYTLQRCDTVSNACSDIVSPDVNIETLKFYVKGSRLDDGIQPRVEILIKGTVTIKGVAKTFTLQTMASQRSTEK